MSKFSTDNRDKRSGAYDPIDKEDLPQPHQVKDRTTPHEAAQPGADVRADELAGSSAPAPARIRPSSLSNGTKNAT